MPNKSHSKATRVFLFLCGILVLGTIVLFIMWLPKKQIDSVQKSSSEAKQLGAKEKAELIDKYRGTLISGVATVATALGGVILLLDYRLNATKSAAERQLSESRLTAEQFTKAAELLTSDNIYTRLCGIYSLEKLANDFPEAHLWSVIKILTAFVQKESPSNFREELRSIKDAEDEFGVPIEDEPLHLELTIDIQAILTVIGKMTRHEEKESTVSQLINLSRTNLKQVNLYKANLRGVNISKTYLSFADLNNADLRRANLRESYLKSADLSSADLRRADLRGADLEHADLSGADLREINLEGSCLRNANLKGANLRKADLRDADLMDANMKGSDLSGADLSDAILSRTRLNNAKLRNVNLKDAVYLVEQQVAMGLLCNTRLPEGMTLDPNRDCEKL